MNDHHTELLTHYTLKYLKNRPYFYAFIRPKELELFTRHMQIKPGMKILDYGCGEGFFTQILLEKMNLDPNSFNLIGIDIDDKAVKQARETGIYKDVISYEGKEMPFEDNDFDLIFSNCVLEHVSELDLNIQEASRILKSGGKFITSVMSDNWNSFLFGRRILGKTYERWMQKQQVHKNLLTHQQWSALFASHKLNVTEAIGYLNQTASKKMDIGHYLSIPSVVTYKAMQKWAPWGSIYQEHNITGIIEVTKPDLEPDAGAAIFYVLNKD